MPKVLKIIIINFCFLIISLIIIDPIVGYVLKLNLMIIETNLDT